MINVTDKEYVESGKAIKKRKISLFGCPLYIYKCTSSNMQVIRLFSTNNECKIIKGFKNETESKSKKD